MIKENKNAMYVLVQPKHTVLSVVVVQDSFPLSQKVHDNLEKLGKISDIVFLFHGIKSKINKDKFTSLYQGCAYLESQNLLGPSFMEICKYSREIFQRHTMIAVTSIDQLGEIKLASIDKIEKINASTNQWPIYSERRLESEEYFEIYSEPEHKKTWINRVLEKECILVDNTRRYSTHTSRSSFMLFRPGVLKILEVNLEDNFIESFIENDIRFFLASSCHYLGLEIFNGDMGDYNV